MKRLLCLLFIAFVFLSCDKKEVEPDLTAKLVGNYSHIFKYEYHDIQEETSWVITKTAENTIQLVYKIESAYTGTKPGTYTLDAPIEVLLDNIKVTTAEKFVVDQVKDVLYGKKTAKTHIRIQAALKQNNLDADMLFIDVESGNASNQQLVMQRK